MKKLIFIHGSGNTSKVWHYQLEHFPDAEAVNLPGHLSLGEPCTSVEDYTVWLHDYITERGYLAPVLAGHSLGGAIVQALG
jgi:pimeloyl-ACP methyl ester carboxylesterase